MNLKICNFRSPKFNQDFKNSLSKTGFAVISNHGIQNDLISNTRESWRNFFLKPLEYKNEFVNRVNNNMGYKGMKTEKALNAVKSDLKEFYHWRPEERLPEETKQYTQNIFAQLEDLGLQLLSILDCDKLCENSDSTILRALYYPAMDFLQEKDAVRAAAHEDINFITLLVAASNPGLQVLDKKGNWHSIPYEENSIVVNVGDSLQLYSGGEYVSTTHRVINPDDCSSDRVSIPLFVHPRNETLLTDKITAKQFLEERISRIYNK